MMKDIKTISSAVQQSLQSPASLQYEEYIKVPSSEDIKLINWLIKKLLSIFTASKKSTLDDPEFLKELKRTWTECLLKYGVTTEEQMLIGIEKALGPETGIYLPKASIFCQWCQPGPGYFDSPCVDSAYSEAISHSRFPENYQWSHVAVEWAAMEAKRNGFLKRGFSDDKIKFIKYYKRAFTHISNGVNLSLALREYKVLIESKSSTPSTQERSAKEIANIKKKLKNISRSSMTNRSMVTV